jgi:enoyl-CoA hydratase/carnithine racemase
VSIAPADIDGVIADLDAVVARRPVTASVLTQVLRIGPRLTFAEAIVVESLAYSMLLAGAEFRAWRTASPVRPRALSQGPRVRLAREGDLLVVTLSRPEARNAVDARMRDALVEALEFALIDPDGAVMELRGDGPAFCAGGDLDEFGQAAGDPAIAHDIRVEQSPARLMHELGARGHARLHGACIGAGIEIPAAAARATAARDTTCRLPEVSMGLIPGAGGTASIPRRIGRQRACFMALSGRAVDAQTALDWGLIDALEDT